MNTVAKCEHKIKIDCYSHGKLFVSCKKCDYKGWCYVEQFDGVSLLLPVLQPLLMPLLVHQAVNDPRTAHLAGRINVDVFSNNNFNPMMNNGIISNVV